MSALQKPLSLIIWVAGISFAAKIIQKATGAIIFDAIFTLRDAAIIGALAWFLVGLIHRGEQKILKEDSEIDQTTLDAIAKLLRISVVITALLITLQTLGYSISGVLAFGGIGGVAVGFAAKDLLANFFGGLIIYLDRPFAVGDWIRSPDRVLEGPIVIIVWRVTRIRTFEKRPLYIPNSVFTTIAVENPTRMLNRRIKETFGIRYDDASKMEIITKKVKEMLKNHQEIDSTKTLIVNFNAFAPSSMDFFIYTFTKTTDWIHFHEVKEDVLLRVLKIVEDEGAQMAFPTSTIHLGDEELLKKYGP
jgi:MscS family membrane protein